MALSNLGAVSGAIVAPVASYTAGTRIVGPETIPAGISAILVLLDLRQITSLTADINWTIEYSIDNGISWEFAGGGGIDMSKSGYTLLAGKLTNKDGGPVRMSGSLRLLPRTDIPRPVRVSFTTNETMTIGATLAMW